MRATMLVLVSGVWLATAAATPARAAAIAAGTPVISAATYALQPEAPKSIQVDINTNRGGAWWASPVWIAIGVLALVVILLLIVMAVRGGGGGTTIVRD